MEKNDFVSDDEALLLRVEQEIESLKIQEVKSRDAESLEEAWERMVFFMTNVIEPLDLDYFNNPPRASPVKRGESVATKMLTNIKRKFSKKSNTLELESKFQDDTEPLHVPSHVWVVIFLHIRDPLDCLRLSLCCKEAQKGWMSQTCSLKRQFAVAFNLVRKRYRFGFDSKVS